MDLGFGSKNPHVGALAQEALAQTAIAQENAVQQQLDQYDDLLNDKDALEKLRARRLQQMQEAHKQQAAWRAAGHGSYQELTGSSSQDTRDVARAFFDATKGSERLVVHFYRPSTDICDVFHSHLRRLAEKHIETRFLKLNVQDCDVSEKGASFLVQRLGIVVMPTLVLIHKRKVVHHIVGFDELGGTTDFSMGSLARLLQQHNAVHEKTDYEDDNDDDNNNRNGGSDVNAIRFNRESRYSSRSKDEEEDF